jgi:hypothetical protein
MSSIVQPTRVLLDPFDATSPIIEARRWFWPLLLLAVCVSASGTAFSLRWDAGPAVLTQLQTTGKLERMTESEISEEIQTATRKALVAGIAKGVFVMPLLTLVLAAALWVFAWLFDRTAPFGQLMTAASLSMLPIALYHVAFTLCALAQHSLPETRVQDLVPSSLAAMGGLSHRMEQLLRGVDFFNLWSVGLLGLGFSSATGMRKDRALLLCLALYVLFIGVFYIGLPVMMAGGPGGPGGHGGPGGAR